MQGFSPWREDIGGHNRPGMDMVLFVLLDLNAISGPDFAFEQGSRAGLP